VAGLVLACSDGRLHESLLALQTRLGLDHADRISVPGGPLALLRSEHERRSLLDWLTTLVPAHDIDTIVLAAHEDCLAYTRARRAGVDERAAVARDLRAARDVVRGRLSGLTVPMYVVPYDVVAARFGSAERVD